MKLLLKVFFVILVFDVSKCAVTEKVKTSDPRTATPINKASASGIKTDTNKNDKLEANHVYLEDVLYALKHQNWTDEEVPCLNQTLLMLRSLQNFTLWAVWQWDSVSSQPEGILYGNRFELGNFDECLDTPWSSKHLELNTQYCLADIVLERTDNAARKRTFQPVQPYQSTLDFMQQRLPHMRTLNELTWGACVPSVCGPRSVERLMAIMLARSHLGMAGMRARISVAEPCQRADKPRRFDAAFYSFLVVITTLTSVALYCTYKNRHYVDSEALSIKEGVIKTFCLHENARSLLKMNKDGIEVFYGIRFLTICFIVMDHQLGMQNSGPVSDGKYVDEIVLSPMGLFLLHDDLFVDTFFLLSGFLTAKNLLKLTVLPSPLILILKRYVRLVVAFAILIFYVCSVFPYTGSGPLWNRAIEIEVDPCLRNWWLNLLMVSNYVNTEDICMVVTWYIPCDFHYFIIVVLLFYLYKRSSGFGRTLAALVAIAALITPGVIHYVKNLPAVQLFTFEFVKNPRASEQFHLTYIKSHTRFAAYLVGVFSGYLFVKHISKPDFSRMSKKWSIIGASIGLLTMLVVMSLGQSYLLRDYHPLEGAVYASLNRPLWALGLAILVLSCSLGHVPLVTKFLSWYPWVPLSRLAYGLYLTHSLIIFRNVMVNRNSIHNDYLHVCVSTFGVIVIGCLASLVIWLIAEAPANNLLALCFTRSWRKRESVNSKQEIESTPSTSKGNPGSTGYLQSNLPSSVHISSKI